MDVKSLNQLTKFPYLLFGSQLNKLIKNTILDPLRLYWLENTMKFGNVEIIVETTRKDIYIYQFEPYTHLIATPLRQAWGTCWAHASINSLALIVHHLPHLTHKFAFYMMSYVNENDACTFVSHYNITTNSKKGLNTGGPTTHAVNNVLKLAGIPFIVQSEFPSIDERKETSDVDAFNKAVVNDNYPDVVMLQPFDDSAQKDVIVGHEKYELVGATLMSHGHAVLGYFDKDGNEAIADSSYFNYSSTKWFSGEVHRSGKTPIRMIPFKNHQGALLIYVKRTDVAPPLLKREHIEAVLDAQERVRLGLRPEDIDIAKGATVDALFAAKHVALVDALDRSALPNDAIYFTRVFIDSISYNSDTNMDTNSFIKLMEKIQYLTSIPTTYFVKRAKSIGSTSTDEIVNKLTLLKMVGYVIDLHERTLGRTVDDTWCNINSSAPKFFCKIREYAAHHKLKGVAQLIIHVKNWPSPVKYRSKAELYNNHEFIQVRTHIKLDAETKKRPSSNAFIDRLKSVLAFKKTALSSHESQITDAITIYAAAGWAVALIADKEAAPYVKTALELLKTKITGMRLMKHLHAFIINATLPKTLLLPDDSGAAPRLVNYFHVRAQPVRYTISQNPQQTNQAIFDATNNVFIHKDTVSCDKAIDNPTKKPELYLYNALLAFPSVEDDVCFFDTDKYPKLKDNVLLAVPVPEAFQYLYKMRSSDSILPCIFPNLKNGNFYAYTFVLTNETSSYLSDRYKQFSQEDAAKQVVCFSNANNVYKEYPVDLPPDHAIINFQLHRLVPIEMMKLEYNLYFPEIAYNVITRISRVSQFETEESVRTMVAALAKANKVYEVQDTYVTVCKYDGGIFTIADNSITKADQVTWIVHRKPNVLLKRYILSHLLHIVCLNYNVETPRVLELVRERLANNHHTDLKENHERVVERNFANTVRRGPYIYQLQSKYEPHELDKLLPQSVLSNGLLTTIVNMIDDKNNVMGLLTIDDKPVLTLNWETSRKYYHARYQVSLLDAENQKELFVFVYSDGAADVAKLGGASPTIRIQMRKSKKIYKVKNDRQGNRYITQRGERHYLSDMRGQFKYLKEQ